MARALLKVLDGGITDFPYSSPDNMMVTCDNLLSKVNNGLMTRPGCQKYAGRTSAFASSRIDYLTTSGSDIFFKSGRDLIVGSANGSTTILYTGGSVGTELITNGSFSGSAGWTIGSSWTLGGGTAYGSAIDNNSTISQTITTEPGEIYYLSFETSIYKTFGIGGSVTSSSAYDVVFNDSVASPTLVVGDYIAFYGSSTTLSNLWLYKVTEVNVGGNPKAIKVNGNTGSSNAILNYKCFKESSFHWGSENKGIRVNFGSAEPLAPAKYIDLQRDNEITWDIPFNTTGLYTLGSTQTNFDAVFQAASATTTLTFGYAYQYSSEYSLAQLNFYNISVKKITHNSLNCFSGSTTFIDSTFYNNQLLFSDLNKPIRVYKNGAGNYNATGAAAPTFIKDISGSAIQSIVKLDSFTGSSYFPTKQEYNPTRTYYFLTYTINSVLDSSNNKIFIETVSNPISYAVGSVYDLGATNTISFRIVANNGSAIYNKYNTYMRIYRTVQGGSVAYLIEDMSLNTLGSEIYYTDRLADQFITQFETLSNTSTTYNSMPSCKSLVTIKDITYAAPSYDDILLGNEAENISNRVRESEAGTLTSFPQDYYTDVQYNIVGLGKAQENLIILSEREIYRQSGNNNSSNPRTDVIHSYAGCLSNNSIVHGKEKLYWAGKDGFYVTNGYETSKLPKADTLRINDTYKTITGNTNNSARNDRIYGGYDYRNNLVYWCVDSVGSASTDNNKIFVYDEDTDGFMVLYGSQTAQMGAWSTAIDFNDTGLIRATGSGYIMQHVDSLTSDQVYSGSWTTLPISSKLRHIAFDFQDQTLMKYVNSVTINARNTGSQTISIKTYDDGDITGQTLQAIVATGSETKRLVKTRRMNGSGIRCFTKELEISSDQNVLDIDSFSYDYVVEDKQSTYYNKDSET